MTTRSDLARSRFRDKARTVLAAVKGYTSGANATPLTAPCAPCDAMLHGRDGKTVTGRTKKLHEQTDDMSHDARRWLV